MLTRGISTETQKVRLGEVFKDQSIFRTGKRLEPVRNLKQYVGFSGEFFGADTIWRA